MKPRRVQTIITILKIGVFPMAAWPLPPNASFRTVVLHNTCRWFTLVNGTLASFGWFYKTYESFNELETLIRVLLELIAVIATWSKAVICSVNARRLQSLIEEMETFLEEINPEEEETINRYIDRCQIINGLFWIGTFVGPAMFLTGVSMSSQIFPGETSYPFSVEPYWIWATLYTIQSIFILEVVCIGSLDCMYALLLWYAGARFELLANKLRSATTYEDVKLCIRRHQTALEYMAELKIVIAVQASAVLLSTVFCIAAGGFVLIRNPPLYVVLKYASLELCSISELFIYSQPADNILEMAERVGSSAYSCDWVGKSREMRKDLLMIAQRSSKPLIISIDGLYPALSLQFYGSAMSASFSYLTTLRAMFADD